MKNITARKLMVFITLFSCIVLGVSLYLQYIKNVEACPLCLMQRICIIFILLFSFICLRFKIPSHTKKLVITQIFFAIAGCYFVGRQLWLISIAGDQPPACLPGLTVLIHYFPWQDLVRALLWGSGDCTEITWKWLGLSLPMWSALYFLSMMIANCLLYSKLRRVKTFTQ